MAKYMRTLYDQNWNEVTVGSEVIYSPGQGTVHEGSVIGLTGATILVKTIDSKTVTLKSKGKRFVCKLDGTHSKSIFLRKEESAPFFDKMTYRLIVRR